MRVFALALLVGLTAVIPVHAQDVADKIKAAVDDPARPATDRERDRNRRPVQTLEFFQLKADDKVLELLPGGGWYTRILAPVLSDKGKLQVAIGTQRVEQNLLNTPGFEEVEVVEMEGTLEREGRFRNIPGLKLKTRNVDLVLTFRNLHNFTAEGRDTLNREVFRVLKKGGLYGVIDHTRRHMQSGDDENRRRVDPVLMIKEIEAAGFEFVDFSDIHYRLDDELIYEVGRRSVSVYLPISQTPS